MFALFRWLRETKFNVIKKEYLIMAAQSEFSIHFESSYNGSTI